MTFNTESQIGAHVALEQLKEHYKHCIKLSTANKINPKNAFDLQLIDYMRDIAISNPDGQMNFKIASSALDVGAKIYSNRVDCIQGVAQKVASSLMMAVDGQRGNQGGDSNETVNDHNASGVSDGVGEDAGDEGAPSTRNKRNRTKRRQIKYTTDDATLSADIEAVVLSEPVSADIQDNDMTSAAALIVHNQCVEEMSRPVFDLDYKETKSSRNISNLPHITVTCKNICNAAIIERAEEPICPRFNGFLFVDKSSKMQGYDTNLDDSVESNVPSNDSLAIEPMGDDGASCDFDANNYDDGVAQDDPMDGSGGETNECLIDLNRTLETVAGVKRSEYDHRLLNTWAGPHAWTTVRIPQTAKKDGAPKSARKRIKLEQMPINVDEERSVLSEDIVEKALRHSSAVIRKWKKLFKPQDYNLTEELVRKGLRNGSLRPEDTYQCVKTAAEALRLVDKDHDYANRSESAEEAPHSSLNFGGFDDVHDDSDDEFMSDPIVNGNDMDCNLAAGLNASLTQQGDLEFAGEHLIEQPHTVAQVVIPYSRAAKKIDVRKLKFVMWNVLLPPEARDLSAQESTTIDNGPIDNGESSTINSDQTIVGSAKKTPSPTPSESAVHLAFSNLYGELPVRVSHRMANDLSQPIAFVTLLHLANEKNLKLISKQDLKDFIIEQDDVIVE